MVVFSPCVRPDVFREMQGRSADAHGQHIEAHHSDSPKASVHAHVAQKVALRVTLPNVRAAEKTYSESRNFIQVAIVPFSYNSR